MKRILELICAANLCAGTLLASPVKLTVQSKSPGFAIPGDFAGLSFETSNLLPDKNGKHLFSAENKQLISLFTTLGIKNLRVGGGTAEMAKYAVPGEADIDQLFAFAKAAGVKVIYTLRLLNGDPAKAAALAKYIEVHYGGQLVCFALGNEPDWRSYHKPDAKITDYPSYLNCWKEFASAILAVAPEAKFGGPDTGSNFPVPKAIDTDFNGESWTQHFADDEKSSGVVRAVFQHDYVGEGAEGVSIPAAIDAMLSINWVTQNYPKLFYGVIVKAQSDGLFCRMTECNDFTGGVDGASNAYASALWALDYMHWQATRHTLGVNFHNKRWIFTDTIYPDKQGNFQVNAKAYGILAFNLGSAGREEIANISNHDGVNLTAYAVRGDHELWVTVINKEHGVSPRGTDVEIEPGENSRRPEAMFLTAPNNDVTAKNGITLGGASISNDHPWMGKWSQLVADRNGNTEVKVAAASAAIVKFETD